MKKLKVLKRVKRLIFLIYFFLIFEGVLRKWILPELSQAIFFIKDPIVLYLYFLSIKYKLFPKTQVFYISLFVIILYILVTLLQILITGYNPIVAIYGLRMYFMYLPLAFIIYSIFDKEDILYYIKFTLLIAIPISILVLIQFLSPPDAFINKNAGTGDGHVFQIVAGIVRPYGTFSFVIGQSFFVPSVLFFLLLLKEFRLKSKDIIYKLLPIIWISLFMMLFLSGSRTTIANVSIIFLVLFIHSLFFLKRKSSIRLILTTISILSLFFISITLYFPDIIEIYMTRSEDAYKSEGSIIVRGLTMLIEFVNYLSTDMHFLGNGIGSGTSGGVALLSGARAITLAEYDLSRIVLEMGALFGLLFILYRVYLSIALLIDSFKVTLILKKYSSILSFAYIFPTILFGQLTANGTVMVYGWFFFGFALAINKILKKEQ